MAIAVTLFVKGEPGGVLQKSSVFFDSLNETSTTFTATKTENKSNKEDTITRLRNLLSQNDTTVVPTPSVVQNEVKEENAEKPVTSSVTLQACGGDDALEAQQLWPQNAVQVRIENGFRTVVQVTTESVQNIGTTTASSSVVTTNVATTTLLQMRAYPVVLGSTSCVSSQVIGVNIDGSLLMNQDTSLNSERGPDDLIGYARDGFPIFGVYEGETDECGGYQHVQGYRYSIGTNRDFILGCYVGIPSPFLKL